MRSYPPSLQFLAISLAFLAGFVDAIAFLQLGGFFVSFMSGNSTRLGIGLMSDGAAAQVAIGLIAAFVIGVIAGSLIGRRAKARQRAAVLALVTLLLVASGCAQSMHLVPIGVWLLAAAMGAENAAFERNGQATFGVTYMTGALVKVGQGLASAFAGGDRWGWTAYALLWLGLVAGVALGARVYGAVGPLAVWIAAGMSGGLSCLSMANRSR